MERLHQGSGQITDSILAPLIFNVVVDLVVRHWMTIMVDDGGASAMTGLTVKELLLPFYADNGMIASRDPAWLQEALTALVALFWQAGLAINVKKTKVMICHPDFIKHTSLMPGTSGASLVKGPHHHNKRRRMLTAPYATRK